MQTPPRFATLTFTKVTRSTTIRDKSPGDTNFPNFVNFANFE